MRIHRMNQYTVNEIFWSPQGEGLRAGEMSLFVRFTGCNLRCSMEAGELSPGGFNCDTEFASGRKMAGSEIIEYGIKLVGQTESWWASNRAWVVFTGGEPALQLDYKLVDDFHQAGWNCAIETNGSKFVGDLGLDWITVSPKVAEHAVKQPFATEVKYVRGFGQAIPKPACEATYQLLSPAFDGLAGDDSALAWCLKLVRENPQWRLSVQQHKLWKVR
jgi:7-carboxy-7-deazaguanine synthase